MITDKCGVDFQYRICFIYFILISNPGMGKTHFNTGIEVKACMNNSKVLFVSFPKFIIELIVAMSKHHLVQYKRKFEKYNLVILDKLVNVSLD